MSINLSVTSASEMLEKAISPKVSLYREANRDAVTLQARWLKYCIRYDVTEFCRLASRGHVSFQDIDKTAYAAVKKLAEAIANDPDITYIPEPCNYCAGALGRDSNGQCKGCGGSR